MNGDYRKPTGSFLWISTGFPAFSGHTGDIWTIRSMTEGCEEKLDLEFIRWILWDSRTRKQKKLWRAMKETCGEKTVVLKNQRQLDGFLESLSGPKDPTEFP